jgi:cytochrome c6
VPKKRARVKPDRYGKIRKVLRSWIVLKFGWKRIIAILIAVVVLVWLPTSANAANLEQGEKVFELQCAGCHVNGGNIIRRGKNLKLKALERNGYGTIEAISEIVTHGKANMSAYNDRLSGEEIQAVAAYVLEQANRGWK